MKTQSARRLSFYSYAVTGVMVAALTTLFTTMQTSNASQIQENEVKLNSSNETELTNVPPIDAAVPSQLQTATFGLG